MCGRSSLTLTEKELEKMFNATFYSEDLERYNPLPNYNVAPSQMCPVIINSDREHINIYRWGLIPFWAKDVKLGYKMINARKETILEKTTFKNAISKRRCLVPMDGFYEWKKEGTAKQAYRIKLSDRAVFCCAGLWATWKSKENETIHSFTIITQEPNDTVAEIHNRMPAILTKEQEQHWLDDSIAPQELLEAIQPYDDKLMEAYKVDNKVGNVRNRDASLIDPIL